VRSELTFYPRRPPRVLRSTTCFFLLRPAPPKIYTLSLHDALPISSNKVWIATDRSRARRCVEACVYGTLDFVGYPRFPAPVEFIAAVIAYYVHPVNIQTACLIMEGEGILQSPADRKSGSAGMPRPISYAVFCLKKK